MQNVKQASALSKNSINLQVYALSTSTGAELGCILGQIWPRGHRLVTSALCQHFLVMICTILLSFDYSTVYSILVRQCRCSDCKRL